MFEKLMNNYYYGKSGKGDYTPDDLPTTRMQLFFDTLRTRFSALFRMNLMYLVIWLPTLAVIAFFLFSAISVMNCVDPATMGTDLAASGEVIVTTASDGTEYTTTLAYTYTEAIAMIRSLLMWILIAFIPAITITGPATAGVSYVTRNWARDEHAFIWSDFKDALKANWKQSIVISFITSLIPLVLYVGWNFYGEMAESSIIMIVPQILLLFISLMWALSVTYMHPMLVTYDLRLMDIIKNSFIMAVAALPKSVGIRLLHCVPLLVTVGLSMLLGFEQWGVLIAFIYYALFGFTLSRFVTASYTNAIFDRFLNSRIEGAKTNQGLRITEDDEYEDDDEEEDDEEEEESDEEE